MPQAGARHASARHFRLLYLHDLVRTELRTASDESILLYIYYTPCQNMISTR
jgi:hypothetical protein